MQFQCSGLGFFGRSFMYSVRSHTIVILIKPIKPTIIPSSERELWGYIATSAACRLVRGCAVRGRGEVESQKTRSACPSYVNIEVSMKLGIAFDRRDYRNRKFWHRDCRATPRKAFGQDRVATCKVLATRSVTEAEEEANIKRSPPQGVNRALSHVSRRPMEPTCVDLVCEDEARRQTQEKTYAPCDS
jgi:hypothetical protein